MVLLTFRVGLFTSVNPIKRFSYRYAYRTTKSRLFLPETLSGVSISIPPGNFPTERTPWRQLTDSPESPLKGEDSIMKHCEQFKESVSTQIQI